MHDDFYDEDGTATQHEAEVADAQVFLTPTLATVKQFPETLLDYSITRWRLEPEVVAAWKDYEPPTVRPTLSARFASTSNEPIRAAVLSICASAVREAGAEFVRRAWEKYPRRGLRAGDGVRLRVSKGGKRGTKWPA